MRERAPRAGLGEAALVLGHLRRRELGQHRDELVVVGPQVRERRRHLLRAAHGEEPDERPGARPDLGPTLEPTQSPQRPGGELGARERPGAGDRGERERRGLDVLGRDVPAHDGVEHDLHEPGRLVLDAEQEPGTHERREHPHDDVGPPVLDRLAQREEEVLLLAPQVRRGGGLVAADERVRAAFRERGGPALHGLVRRSRGTRVLEPQRAELPHRLEHPVAHDPVVLGDPQERLGDQPVERVEGSPRRRAEDRPRAARDRLRRLRRESVGEHGGPAQQVLLGRTQQVPAPLDHGLEGPVPVRGEAVARAQEREALVEVPLDVLDAHRAHARRGELDREREAVQALAQPGDDVGRQARTGPDGASALDEEPDRGAVPAVRTQGVERVDLLGREAQGRPARREDGQVRRRAEQVRGPARGTVEDVLAVVQDEQGGPPPHTVEHLSAHLGRRQAVREPPRARGRGDPQAVRERHDDVLVGPHARELDDDHEVDRPGRRRTPCDLLREARLAEPARTEDRDEPGPGERVPHPLDVGLPADQRVGSHAHTTHLRRVGAGGGRTGRRGRARVARYARVTGRCHARGRRSARPGRAIEQVRGEPAEVRCRVRAEVADERVPDAGVRREGLVRATRRRERHHEVARGVLVRGVALQCLGGERLDRLVVPRGGRGGPQRAGERRAQSSRLGGQRLPDAGRQVLPRLAVAPQREGGAQRGDVRGAGPRVRESTPGEVEVGGHAERVAAGARDDRAGRAVLAQPRHEALERAAGVLRGVRPPQLVDERPDADGPPARERERHDERRRARPARHDGRPAGPGHPDGAQDADEHVVPSPGREVVSRHVVEP